VLHKVALINLFKYYITMFR